MFPVEELVDVKERIEWKQERIHEINLPVPQFWWGSRPSYSINLVASAIDNINVRIAEPIAMKPVDDTVDLKRSLIPNILDSD